MRTQIEKFCGALLPTGSSPNCLEWHSNPSAIWFQLIIHRYLPTDHHTAGFEQPLNASPTFTLLFLLLSDKHGLPTISTLHQAFSISTQQISSLSPLPDLTLQSSS